MSRLSSLMGGADPVGVFTVSSRLMGDIAIEFQKELVAGGYTVSDLTRECVRKYLQGRLDRSVDDDVDKSTSRGKIRSYHRDYYNNENPDHF